MHNQVQYAESYNHSDDTCVWSEERNGIRMRLRVVSKLPDGYDKTLLSSLLRRALKEMLIRRGVQYIDTDDVSNEDVIKWCTIIRQQVTETLREAPEDKQQVMNLAILTKILNDYFSKFDYPQNPTLKDADSGLARVP